MGQNGLPISALLQMLASQQQGGQDPNQQMSQQGQFNPANVQAQGGAGPQPFSFAPVQGGLGRNILNALANAGKAATYVAEDPRERERDDARAQQLWETKQKMAMAAGEFGQREKDRAQQAADTKARITQAEADRQSQQQIEKDRIKNEPHTIETPNGPALWDAQSQSYKPIMIGGQPVGPKSQPKPDTPEQQFFDSPEEQGKTMAQKVADYAKASQKPEKPGAESGTWQMVEDANGKPVLFNSKTGQTKASPGISKAGTFAKGQAASDKALKPYQDTLDMISESKDYAASPSATNDYALLMNFIGVTKPESLAKLRLNQNEVALAKGTRGSFGDLQALASKIENGQMLTADQRQSMLNTMGVMGRAAQRHMDSLQSAPQGQGATGGKQGDPLGIR